MVETQPLRSASASPPAAAALTDSGRDLRSLTALGRSTDPAQRDQALRQVAREFEAIFLSQMVAAMRQTVGDGGLVPKGQGEQIFEGMLDEEYARKLAGRGGPGGLAEVLYRQLSRQQTAAPASASRATSAAGFFAQLPAAPGVGSRRP